MIVLGTNISSLKAQSSLKSASSNLSTTLERLGSGQRINRASDDAAGLALATSLDANRRIYSQALLNLNDGISYLNVADTALSSMQTVLERIKELATQSANGTLNLTQRKSLDTEAAALSQEYNRILSSATYNGAQIIGSQSSQVRLQAGAGANQSLSVSIAEELKRTVGSGSFTRGSAVILGGTTITGTGSTVGDFNGDSIDDFIYSDLSSAYLNTGSTTGISSISSLGLGAGTKFLASGDFNGDNKLDIVITNIDATNTTIAFGNGDGSFGIVNTIENVGGRAIKVADFDNDGNLDFAIAKTGGINVYRGNGNGTFHAAESYSVTGTPNSMQLGDINGDGLVDLIIGSSASNTVTILKNGGSSFSVSQTFSASTPSVLAVGDLNNDGYDDALITNSATPNIFYGSSQGLSTTAASNVGFTSTAAQIVDYDGDGNLDIVASESGSQNLSILKGDGAGNFTRTRDTSGTFGAIALYGDFNKDGAIDLIGFGSGPFARYYNPGVATTTTSVARFDLNDKQAALQALDSVNGYLTRIASERGSLGSSLSRINSAVATTRSTVENTVAARNRIVDADVASETASLLRQQIIQDSATAVLSHVNQNQSLVLTLLKVPDTSKKS